MVEIREALTKKERRRFILFPYRLYRENPYWVPPLLGDEKKTLDPEKNPAREFCEARLWLAYKNGEPAGRIAGIINRRYIDIWNKKFGRFGWMDFTDDTEVSSVLLSTVEEWAATEGLEAVHGPLGFTDFDREGVLIEGFEELGTLADVYNFPYYAQHLEACGYRKDADWYEYEVTIPEKLPARAEKAAALLQRKNSFRVADLKNRKQISRYADEVFAMINAAYDGLYGFVPLSERQISFYVDQYLGHVIPDYLKLVLDRDDRVAGIIIGMPSLSSALRRAKGRLFPFGFIHLLRALKNNRYVDLYLAAVRPDLKGKGVSVLFITELVKTCIENGVVSMETSRELEDNLLVQAAWKEADARLHKKRRCYIKYLPPVPAQNKGEG
jgi:GNAT superfamily N-acetyltransferase